jgi:micrococcal nuclease
MDAPERAQEPYGAQATDALSRLAPAGSQVRLEPDVRATDRYGRTLAYVWTDSLMVNWALVRAGWALQATYPPNVQWVDELGRAQERAREEGAGLWGVEGFACPPDAYRARRCG